MGAKSSSRHHGGVRGDDLSRSSLLFEGPFGRIFRTLPSANFGPTDKDTVDALDVLAKAMTADKEDPDSKPDDEEGGIPSVYTYLGQFIDHDLTFDPASSLQKQNDPDALVDFRTPRFDLDNVYGRGPDDQPYMYRSPGKTPKAAQFILGTPLTGAAANPSAMDLPRANPPKGEPRRAIIGDPRNDENVIVSQLQGLFHRFHNKIVQLRPDWEFEQVQREVRFHYQWMVLNDFLPTIVAPDVLALVLPHIKKKTSIAENPPELEFYHARTDAYMPLEFSAAAYRFGHSMVRPGYRLSETIAPLSIFSSTAPFGLTGFREFPSNWAIDWNLFMTLEPRPPGDKDNDADQGNALRTQLAYRIDTSLVNPLGNLPEAIAKNPNTLALRNLLRGWRMRLPSGQTIARAMGLKPLADKDIRIGKFTGDAADIVGTMETIAGGAFKGNCPLWTYVLAETVAVDVKVPTTAGDKVISTRKLGPVGGRIVAETFAGIMTHDSNSYLSQDPLWTPQFGKKGVFGLKELIQLALS